METPRISSVFHLKQIFIFLVFLTSLGSLALLGYNFHRSKQLITDEIEKKSIAINSELTRIHDFAMNHMLKHYEEIRKGDGSLNDIQKIINTAAYEGNGLVRFIWADEKDIVQLSSHTQHLTAHTKASAFEFITHAHQNPGNVYISNILTHPEPFMMQRELITYSIGVISSKTNKFIGTHYAIIDFYHLNALLTPLLDDCHCLYRLVSPRGEIFRTNISEPSIEKTSASGILRFEAFPDPNLLSKLREKFILLSIIALTLIHFTFMVIYNLIRKKILRPLSKVLTLVPTAALAGNAQSLEGIEQLQHLVEDYGKLQHRLREQESAISECRSVISQLHAQQDRFLKASSSEMRQMYSAICNYAHHLEEMVLQQQLHPDAPYDFDDVREMGDHLRHLSESFLTFSQKGSQKTEAADPARILQHLLQQLQPFIDRRNLHIQVFKDREVWVMQPSSIQLTHALTRSMLFAAIRFAEDEAQLDIHLHCKQEMVLLQMHVSRFRQSILPPSEQDFSMLMPSLKRDMTNAISARIASDANILIAEAASHQLQGTLHYQVHPSQRGFTIISQIAVSS